MRILFFFLSFLISSALIAQSRQDTLKKDSSSGKKVISIAEEPAEPMNGLKGLYKWIGDNLKYPPNARKNRIQGKVLVKFIVEMNGEISNVEISKGFDSECDQEAVRVVRIMPKWKPGKQNGKPVRQMQYLPIGFKLAK